MPFRIKIKIDRVAGSILPIFWLFDFLDPEKAPRLDGRCSVPDVDEDMKMTGLFDRVSQCGTQDGFFCRVNELIQEVLVQTPRPQHPYQPITGSSLQVCADRQHLLPEEQPARFLDRL